MIISRTFLGSLLVLALLASTDSAQADIYAQMGYGEGEDGVLLLTEKCPADSTGELQMAVLRLLGRVQEGCYVINNRGNPVVRWQSGEIQELDISDFKKSHVKQELSLIGIREDDPMWEGWRQVSPIFSVMDNCTSLERMPAIKSDKSSYEFASMSPPDDIFVFQYVNNKSNLHDAFAKSELACQQLLASIKNASAIGINTKNTVRFGIALDYLPVATKRKLKNGALVSYVIKDSAALKAGIRKGDVIIAVAGTPVQNANQALAAMRTLPITTKSAMLTVIRQGVKTNIEVIFDAAAQILR